MTRPQDVEVGSETKWLKLMGRTHLCKTRTCKTGLQGKGDIRIVTQLLQQFIANYFQHDIILCRKKRELRTSFSRVSLSLVWFSISCMPAWKKKIYIYFHLLSPNKLQKLLSPHKTKTWYLTLLKPFPLSTQNTPPKHTLAKWTLKSVNPWNNSRIILSRKPFSRMKP